MSKKLQSKVLPKKKILEQGVYQVGIDGWGRSFVETMNTNNVHTKVTKLINGKTKKVITSP